MASAKAKKKLKIKRKLEKKKKKLKKKLAALLKKDIERGAANILKLAADIANLNEFGRRSFLRMAQDEIGWRDEKALKTPQLRSLDHEPTTHDLDFLKFRTNHIRKASINSDTSKIGPQPERHAGMRSPPPQKPYSVSGPVKSAVLSPRPLWPVNLPRPASSPAPTPASRQLITYKPQALPLMSESWLTIVGVAWTTPLNQFTQAPSNYFPSVNFPPAEKFSQNSTKPTVYYYHSVTVQCPPGVQSQPVAEKPSAVPSQPEPDSCLQTGKSVGSQSKESGADPKTADSRKNSHLKAWRNKGDLAPKNLEGLSASNRADPTKGKNFESDKNEKNTAELAQKSSKRRESCAYGYLIRSHKNFDADSDSDIDAAETRSCSSEPADLWSLKNPDEEEFSVLAEPERKNQVSLNATSVDNVNNLSQRITAMPEGLGASDFFEPQKNTGATSTQASEGTLIASRVNFWL